MKDFFIDSEKGKAFLVLEHAGNDNLSNFVNNNPSGCLDEDVSREIARQLLITLIYLESKSIAHRDLKPDNILISGCKQFP